MISPEKFQSNFESLKAMIPTKPLVYTPQYPKSIEESFKWYLRTSSINVLGSLTNLYNEEEWPLPLWIDPERVRIGFVNRLNYFKVMEPLNPKKRLLDWFPPYARVLKYNKRIPANTDFWDYLMFPAYNQIYFKQDFTEGILVAFKYNVNYIQNKLIQNPMLNEKKEALNEIFGMYKKGFWLASITTLFPLLDHLARKHLKVSNLRNDIKKICTQFQKCGIGADNTDVLMPQVFQGKMAHAQIRDNKKVDWEEIQKTTTFEFGLIGPLLSSFLRFANKYYAYYTDDQINLKDLNRHAILHGAVTDSINKVNAVKLISFLVLFVELEPVFKILFNEN